MAWFALPLVVLAVATVPLIVIDVREHRLPNRITLPLIPAMAVALLIASWGAQAWERMPRALLGGLALLLVYFVLHLVYPAGLGMGDVKLAPSLGLLLAWLSWDAVLWGTFLAFLLSALVGLLLILVRRATMKTAIAFGPFMLVGAWLAALVAFF